MIFHDLPIAPPILTSEQYDVGPKRVKKTGNRNKKCSMKEEQLAVCSEADKLQSKSTSKVKNSTFCSDSDDSSQVLLKKSCIDKMHKSKKGKRKSVVETDSDDSFQMMQKRSRKSCVKVAWSE